ncbi:retrovirus-related pol polyprotein from transposon [Moniliophthora roreri]|nr:retrovirus-related pol polyprotein from transposon [Moniliophthora roreri]
MLVSISFVVPRTIAVLLPRRIVQFRMGRTYEYNCLDSDPSFHMRGYQDTSMWMTICTRREQHKLKTEVEGTRRLQVGPEVLDVVLVRTEAGSTSRWNQKSQDLLYYMQLIAILKTLGAGYQALYYAGDRLWLQL